MESHRQGQRRFLTDHLWKWIGKENIRTGKAFSWLTMRTSSERECGEYSRLKVIKSLRRPVDELAIERIQEQDFDVVITDLKMPGMDGIEVLKTIKILQPEVPVIIITGYSTVDTAVDAMKNGAFDYIAKPFTSSLIVDKVKKAVTHKISGVETLCL